MVYSPQDGMTSGGHFLSYSSLHLTELALSYDCSENEYGTLRSYSATNSVHPSLHRYIFRLLLALPHLHAIKSKHFGRTSDQNRCPETAAQSSTIDPSLHSL